jgi:DNA helicase-2/ATP-dependent DNA helicase PcrA
MQIMVNALLHYDEADYLFAFASSNFFAGGANKATMQNIRNDIQGGWKKKVDESEQAIVLQNLIDANLVGGQKECSWSSIIASLRTRPLLQVIRELYGRLKPWISYGANDLWKQNYYRMNVDLLFEELISACNTNTLTINTLSNYLSSSIMSCKNVDSRVPEEKVDDIIVRCVTIHKAKGLEYGAVILPFCSAAINVMKRANLHTFVKMEHGQYQIGYQLKLASGEKIRNSYFSEQTEKDERKREETRILYVAMTRAIRSFSWIIDDSKKTESWQQLIFDGVTNNAI